MQKPNSADSLINSDATSNQWAIAAALEPLDKVAIEMEARWGVGVLERFVTPETAARFASARKKLNDVIYGNDWQEVAKRASVMIRGWQALEKEAIETGKKPAEADRFWCVESSDGTKYVFVQHGRDMQAAIKQFPDHQAWAMTEVVRILAGQSLVTAAAARAKEVFPGAEVTAVRKPNVLQKAGMNDEIPF